MLETRDIRKQYKTGDLVQTALDGVSLRFRDHEFVAVLGPSGSGKTTLLNIIGGLDRYDDGDMLIHGVSTKQFADRDWDAYRNHSIGFVFQSYNLIAHQSILANVELALRISGVSRGERRRRAKAVLAAVGLGDQLHKKPNQLSGGQMQRVAIARALVNNPDILLADEPTGALDSETSRQVIGLLKEVSKDRLVIMVTHDAELAGQYATRIIKLRDGKIAEDSDPFPEDDAEREPPKREVAGKSSMSFLSSLALSFCNLRTKLGRTLLTAFAGSIGIIGIALILALSSGVNAYIGDIQKSTMTAYPITISAESMDVAGILGGAIVGDTPTKAVEREGVFANNADMEQNAKMAASMIENDLTAFKNYLDNPDSEIRRYLGENGVVYTYNVKFDVYTADRLGRTYNTNIDVDSDPKSAIGAGDAGDMPMMMVGTSTSGARNFSELMPGKDGAAVSQVTTDSYDMLYGRWPEAYNEVLLVLDENNAIPTPVLYQLGFLTKEEYGTIRQQIEKGETQDTPSFTYEEVCGHVFHLIPACDYYTASGDGRFASIRGNAVYEPQLLAGSIDLTVVGVIRPVKGSANANISTAVAYTSKLTDHVIAHTNESAVVSAQVAMPEISVLSGLRFTAPDDNAKIEQASAYLSNLKISEKASIYPVVLYMHSMSGGEGIGQGVMETARMDETALAAALDTWLAESPDEQTLLRLYAQYVQGATYSDNLAAFGKVSYDAPSSISIYSDSFENKAAIAACIVEYNKTVSEKSQIKYVDYVELLTSSLKTIVGVISYVLIAFVSVSLIVSCIMIGVITHISVLERTKEIGILRALGASRGNISQVFNAETFIIGIVAGLLGVVISGLLIVLINAVLGAILGEENMRASLSLLYAGLLVGISVIVTVIGGLLPAKKAARKDPVVALRTE